MLSSALLLTFLCTRGAKNHIQPQRPNVRQLRDLLRDPHMRTLCILAAVHWACTAPQHAYFAIEVATRGLPTWVVGTAYCVSIFGEVAVFWAQRPLLEPRFSPNTLLIIAAFASAIRWAVTPTLESPAALILIQLLHGATFGLFWGTAMTWLRNNIPTVLRTSGQSLATTAMFGIGNLLGTQVCGVIYDTTGTIAGAYWGAAALEVGLVLFLVRRPLTESSRLVCREQAHPTGHQSPTWSPE